MTNLNDLFQDKNQNNIPDIMESNNAKVFTTTQFIVDGKSYNSIEEMPPDVKAKFEESMKNFDQTPLNFGNLAQLLPKNANFLGSNKGLFYLSGRILSFNLISLLFTLLFSGPVIYFYLQFNPESQKKFLDSFITYQIAIVLIAVSIPFLLNYFSSKKRQTMSGETAIPKNNSDTSPVFMANNFVYSRGALVSVPGKIIGKIFMAAGLFLIISTYINNPEFFEALQKHCIDLFTLL